jgi:hypothetical protein
VGNAVDDRAIVHARQFVDAWIRRMDPLYVAVSLPDDFEWPADDAPHASDSGGGSAGRAAITGCRSR